MSYHVDGVIEGIAPILFNRPYTEPASKKTEEARKKTATIERVYRNGHGLYLPSWSFKKMLGDGITMAGLKMTGNKSLLPWLLATLYLDDDPLFGVEDMDFLHEVWGRVPPKRGAMVKVWRPALNTGWKLTFGLSVADDLLRPE